jgi:hypothetical protein
MDVVDGSADGHAQLAVVGAGVGRTGTHSLKVALEELLGGRCHHMIEVFGDPEVQVPGWMGAIDGRPTDWGALLGDFRAIVDWPGASFWPEILAANPGAIVLLSTRDAEGWYRSASNTIFQAMGTVAPEARPWMDAVTKLLHDRFSDRFDDAGVMIDAFNAHNERVRREVPPAQLIDWQPGDGWEPICAKLGVAVPDHPFPVTNTTDEFRANFGMDPLSK